MATAHTSPNDLTRQQLDELDALLQRMLSLPITPPEVYPPPGQSAAVSAMTATPAPVATLPMPTYDPPLP